MKDAPCDQDGNYSSHHTNDECRQSQEGTFWKLGERHLFPPCEGGKVQASRRRTETLGYRSKTAGVGPTAFISNT